MISQLTGCGRTADLQICSWLLQMGALERLSVALCPIVGPADCNETKAYGEKTTALQSIATSNDYQLV